MAAASVLDAGHTDEWSDERHATALANLLLGRASEAVRMMGAAAPTTGDARLWSDLAAAHLQLSITANRPRSLGKALAAADAALHLDPSLPEALFNRALVLERYGFRDIAREAWVRYLVADGAGPWADEARKHVTALVEEPPFAAVLDRSYEHLANDASAAQSLVRRYPQECRTWGETEILGRWAALESSGKHDEAEIHLRLARALGDALAGYRGDHMLARAVAAIDHADPSSRALLAAGHVAFREGQKAYRGNKASSARPVFVTASEMLERGGSPVSLLAQYFAANTRYDEGQVREACTTLEHLLESAPADLPAHRAQLEWQLGRAYFLDGRLGKSLDTLGAAATDFDRLDERPYAAAVREIRAEVYDRMGDPERAWAERMECLSQLGRQLSPRLLIAISSMSKAALIEGEWDQAAAFLDVEVDVVQKVGTPMRRVEMRLLRSKVRQHLGDRVSALADLSAARADIARLNDPALSSLMEDEAAVIEALTAPNQRESVRLLTQAIASYQPRGRRMLLPELLLDRGRANVELGDRDRAAADFEAGIAELERDRELLPQGESRWGILGSVEDLFDEAISLSLAQGDPRTALQYAERARARQLRDVLAVGSSAIRTEDIPPDTVIAEYVLLRDRLVLFTIARDGIRATEQPLSRAALVDRVTRFSHAIRQDDRAETLAQSAWLHRILIDPIRQELDPRRRLILVPDNALSSIAFSALRDASGRYLVEHHEVVVSPSAAVFLTLEKRTVQSEASPRLLVVTNPARTQGEDALTFADAEGAAITRLYARSTTLSGNRATLDAFRRLAPGSTVIHFAGHATAGGGRQTALLLASSQAADDDRADAASIASMHLVHTTTVVLAACDTANGEIRGTEGTISVARSFMAAGVPSVIATLQPVADQDSSQFFPRLHELIAQGNPPGDALRLVQLEWVHRHGASISTWAAVEAFGR